MSSRTQIAPKKFRDERRNADFFLTTNQDTVAISLGILPHLHEEECLPSPQLIDGLARRIIPPHADLQKREEGNNEIVSVQGGGGATHLEVKTIVFRSCRGGNTNCRPSGELELEITPRVCINVESFSGAALRHCCLSF